jgi:hypothetical protein
MLCRMLYKAIRVAIACVVLLSMSPATAGAMPPMTGTSTAVKPTSRTAIIEAYRDGDGREGKETQGSSVPLFISGVIVGLLLGLLGSRVLPGWQGRQRRQRDIDRLTEQFQTLFREIDQGKNQYP